MKRRVHGVMLQALDDRRRSRPIGIADSQVDHVTARGDGGLLLLVDLGKEVGREFPQPFRLHEFHRRHRGFYPRLPRDHLGVHFGA